MKRRCMLGCVNVFEKTRQPDIVLHRPCYRTSVAHQSQPPVEAGGESPYARDHADEIEKLRSLSAKTPQCQRAEVTSALGRSQCYLSFN